MINMRYKQDNSSIGLHASSSLYTFSSIAGAGRMVASSLLVSMAV